MPKSVDTLILGAGMSGLGAALSLRAPAYEAEARPGGVCYSSYVGEDGVLRDPEHEDVSGCFRFEPAGGHWLFGASEQLLARFAAYAKFERYTRRAAVFFPSQGWLVPYPVQEHLRYFEAPLRERILREILTTPPTQNSEPWTFAEWLLKHFGPTLCELFFFPFNERYTTGLHARIAPQDAYKTPINRERILAGAERDGLSSGYNTVFHYPRGGLDRFVRNLGGAAQIRCRHRVETIDTSRRIVHFSRGDAIAYRELICSIPLHRALALCGLCAGAPADPATAVLVVNVSAEVGAACPPYHWVYLSHSKSGLHRVGFYDHVDRSFLPSARRNGSAMVSLYAERSYRADKPPSAGEIADACRAIVAELQEWGFIRTPIVVHPTFTNPAYTWSWPGSRWVDEACQTLLASGVRQIGRYGRWRFQGMADSFTQGWDMRDRVPPGASKSPFEQENADDTHEIGNEANH